MAKNVSGQDARQGRATGRVLRILIISLGLAVIVAALVWLFL